MTAGRPDRRPTSPGTAFFAPDGHGRVELSKFHTPPAVRTEPESPSKFFEQWFDTAYHGSKPQITGPGLHGHPFYAHGCTAPGHR